MLILSCELLMNSLYECICYSPIPDQGNTAEIVLTVLHRNFLGVDEFLGRISIPLADLDVYERPRNRWYTLQSKLGKENKKERGELEVRVAFLVKAGSLTDLSKKDKHKSSIGHLSQVAQSVGGSLLSLGTLEKSKGIKKFAKSIGSKINVKHKKKSSESDVDSIGSINSLKRRTGTYDNAFKDSKQVAGDADPGVISEDEDEFTFDDLSHKSSASSLSYSNQNETAAINSIENLAGGEVLRRHTLAVPPRKPPRFENKPVDEWEAKLYGKTGKTFHNSDVRDSVGSKVSSQIEEEHEESVAERPASATPKPHIIRKDEKEEIFSKANTRRG